MQANSTTSTRTVALCTLAAALLTIAGLALANSDLSAHEPTRIAEAGDRLDTSALTAHIARRELVYNIASNSMCALGFSDDQSFDWSSGPAPVTLLCESHVNPICSEGYLPIGVLATKAWSMSYRCTKVEGGPAAQNPVCEARFTTGGTGGNEYTCTAQVQPQCWQEHWIPQSLMAEGYRVTYQCLAWSF